MPGIVLVDEIETHLHLELQKKILDLLTTVFPNIQFVVSTHSPFILNSLENTVVYDLEEIAKLELFLDEIPDYLALDLTTEYRKLKLEFENREDI